MRQLNYREQRSDDNEMCSGLPKMHDHSFAHNNR
jgi:hypothetical protein